jgi:hypothetical protein
MSKLFSSADLEGFAEYLGVDYDQFYESYYQVNYDETECDLGEVPVSICDNGNS